MNVQSMHENNHLDLQNLPEFDCLCELCDCGCFERSKQPHSAHCKKLIHHVNIKPDTSLDDLKSERHHGTPILSGTHGKQRYLPKGFLSEYQRAYFSTSDTNRVTPAKLKDSLSLFNDDGKHHEPDNHRDADSRILRSKTLNRLNSMIPTNENVSWYQSDYNFYGNDPQQHPDAENSKRGSSTSNHYKNEYNRVFDEVNRGFVDTYSLSKGGALLKVNSNSPQNQRIDHFHSSSSSTNDLTQFHSQTENNFQSPSFQAREHDLRSVWIPKKFAGRNMFVSHIDSTLFPGKAGKEYKTQYNQNFDTNSESKTVFEKAPYEKIDKSVKYVLNHENKYVPSIRWYPTKERDLNTYAREDAPLRTKSSYQVDFERPNFLTNQASSKNGTSLPMCRAAALQVLMFRDKNLVSQFDKHKRVEVGQW